MRRTLRGWVLTGLVLCALVPVVAQALPLAWYQVGSEAVQWIDSSKWSAIAGGQFLNYSVETEDYRISAIAIGKYDPFLAWGVAVANTNAAPLSFTFGFSTPITPVTTINTVYASFAGSVTDINGDGQDVIPNQPDSDGDGLVEIATNWLDGTTNAGVDIGLGYSDPAGGEPGHSDSFGPYQDSTAGPLGAWTAMGTTVQFTLSANNDIATLNGYFGIDPVPEPSALILLGSGLVGAGLVWMRRRRARA